MSLRSHVLAGLAVVALALAVTSLVIVRSVQAGLIRQVDSQLVRAVGPARRLVPASGAEGSTNDATLPLTALYVAYAGGVDGQEPRVQLTGDSTAAVPPPVPAAVIRQAVRSGAPITLGSSAADTHFRLLVRRVSSPRGVLLIGESLSTIDDTMTRLIGVEVIGTGSILTILGLVAWWVVGLGIRPIKRMTSAATAIAGGDVATRVPEADPSTEAGQLGAALNGMLERIEEAFSEQRSSDRRLRRFAADASHELRTPLATVRGYTELYRSGALGAPGALSDAVGRIESETIRMSDLVDELLLLARLDQRRPLQRSDLDLPRLIGEVVADARAAEPGRAIDLVIEPDVGALNGDEGLIRRAVGNLVRNALQHTPPSSRVRVAVSSDGARVWIEVADDGPGMTAETAEHVFERFYRADSSRSRGQGGSGLGLAIVREAVEAHGGTVDLESSERGGTVVRSEFPTDGDGGPR